MAEVVFQGIGKVFEDGTRALSDVSLEVADGEFIILVGPSGCGKTTLLRLAAGLDTPSEGDIFIGSRRVNDLEPRDRDVAMVFQSYALYPHMSVYDNLAFGLEMRGVRKRAIRERVHEIARVLDLDQLLSRRPRQLSGGQRQRVAMGRAIIRGPSVFLLDEPLSNLDARLRVRMRAEIARIQQELDVTTIYVTHDQVEALTMGTRVAILRNGVLQQTGTPQDLYTSPKNLFVARFIGSPEMNLAQAQIRARENAFVATIGPYELEIPSDGRFGRLGDHLGKRLALGVRPENLVEPSAERPLPRLTGTVLLREFLGGEVLVHLEVEATPVVTSEVLEVASDVDETGPEDLLAAERAGRMTFVARLPAGTIVRPGDRASVAIDPGHLYLFDLETGLNLRLDEEPVQPGLQTRRIMPASTAGLGPTANYPMKGTE